MSDGESVAVAGALLAGVSTVVSFALSGWSTTGPPPAALTAGAVTVALVAGGFVSFPLVFEATTAVLLLFVASTPVFSLFVSSPGNCTDCELTGCVGCGTVVGLLLTSLPTDLSSSMTGSTVGGVLAASSPSFFLKPTNEVVNSRMKNV